MSKQFPINHNIQIDKIKRWTRKATKKKLQFLAYIEPNRAIISIQSKILKSSSTTLNSSNYNHPTTKISNQNFKFLLLVIKK